MSILGRLALLFIVVPLVELVLLVQLGRILGLWPTIGVVVLTGIGGALLARAEGIRALWAFRREVAQGRLPEQTVWDGLTILVGGALLLTPGLLTDVVGFLLLVVPTRRMIHGLVRRWLRREMAKGAIGVTVVRPEWPGAARPPGDFVERGAGEGPGGGEDREPREGEIIM